jgi:hypothetical protein
MEWEFSVGEESVRKRKGSPLKVRSPSGKGRGGIYQEKEGESLEGEESIRKRKGSSP